MFAIGRTLSTPDRLLPMIYQRGTAALAHRITGARAPWPARILLATDGSWLGNAAVAAARIIAARSGASCEIVAVYAPRVPLPVIPGLHGMSRCPPSERPEARRVLQGARRQLAELCGGSRGGGECPLRLEVGDPAMSIVRLAAERQVDLVVLGVGRCDTPERRSGAITAARVVRYASTAVYAAAAGCEEPDCAVVAFPDGVVSERTIRAAIDCLTPTGRLWIALPEHGAESEGDVPVRSPRDLVRRACGPRADVLLGAVHVERVNVASDMLLGVLRLADDVGARLVVAPNRGDPGPVRAFLPNLADPLLRVADCSVLVVPDDASRSFGETPDRHAATSSGD